jgi:hypothetical protein
VWPAGCIEMHPAAIRRRVLTLSGSFFERSRERRRRIISLSAAKYADESNYKGR